MKKSPYSELLACLKKQAMLLANTNQVSYMRALESLVRQNNIEDLHRLQCLVKSEALTSAIGAAEILPCPRLMQTIYRIRIGKSTWSLRVSKHGPNLYIEDRPYCEFEDDSRTSDLGLFQVFVRGVNMRDGHGDYPRDGWVVTRYGHYRAHTLEFFSDEDAQALSYHFGIPFAPKTFGRYASYSQSEYSEFCFLKSPAFAALRRAFRCGQITLPPMISWNYGLCSLWPHLVAMSDKDFEDVERIMTWCFRAIGMKLPHEALLERWSEVPTLGLTGMGVSSLGDMFRLRNASRKKRHSIRAQNS
ncbi:hypothetical protein [Janthinobacterium lividum]|uniref:hypothetical protein n=1 Tax=Janthinobacterium lividum TaxID=29581 RepID=UPI000873D47D|nr:hypothetical protein [Janthinobacterium lividum]MCC7716908.1 hypothetical protein [Janthinobacterium lividum]OEZ62310.1 hypothetical protein JANLI_10140 [Janthinobacterium lividum]WQE31856.1 hypothetical protein U0004_28530 [Janthinobacterium lividum]STS86120.1 Uncharacterised protein [Janthinobacterium lividum]